MLLTLAHGSLVHELQQHSLDTGANLLGAAGAIVDYGQAVVGQLPLMALMALYTIGGLTLLFAI